MKTSDLKVGEKLVCIDNFTSYTSDTKLYILKKLELGKIYTHEGFVTEGWIAVSEIPEYVFENKRFVRKSELRKYKLEKLNEI